MDAKLQKIRDDIFTMLSNLECDSDRVEVLGDLGICLKCGTISRSCWCDFESNCDA